MLTTMPLLLHGLERFAPPEQEFTFAPPRRWRFDLAWPQLKVAFEKEGGTWNGGRHTRGAGYEKDCCKYNAAAILGWLVIRATTTMIADGRAWTQLRDALSARTP